jgi:hypothetical protein
MLRILLKDARAAYVYWLPGLFLNILFTSTFIQVNLLYLLAGMFLAFLFVISVPILEDKHRLDLFLLSLPVKRSQVVGARYIGAGLTLIVSLAVLLSTAPLAAAVFEVGGAGPGVLLTPPGIAFFLLPLIFSLSLFLPLYFKLGLGRALWALAASCLVLAALAGVAVGLAARLAGKSASSIFPLDAEIGAVPFKPFLPLAAWLGESLGTPGFYALLLAVVAVIVTLSLRLSVRFYSKREF